MNVEPNSNVKVAFSHDWLNGQRGGEKCLDSMIRLFPDSEIYTLLHEGGAVSKRIESLPIHTSFLQKNAWMKKNYKHCLPLLPMASAGLKIKSADMIISTNHCVAKGIRKPTAETPHLCYCFTPMRYAWLFFDEYFGRYPWVLKVLIKAVLAGLRKWDYKNSDDVTHFVAISHYIKDRIRSCYGRDADVIYPPVDTEYYRLPEKQSEGDFYLVVSALVPYKRVDMAVEVCTRLKKKLIVIGKGPESERLKAIAGPEVGFLGWADDSVIRDHYQRCKALIFPGEEDFGIVPVEVQACGRPVIAYAKGGALETVVKNETGLFFEDQTIESLENALTEFESKKWDSGKIRANAERFSEPRFRSEIQSYVRNILNQKTNP